MKYIELMGPPGAGKSTVHSQLITSSDLFGGINENAVERLLLKKIDSKYEFLYKSLPSAIQRPLQHHCLSYRLRHNEFKKFVGDYPDFIEAVSVAMNAASHDTENIFYSCQRSAERFQLGISTVRNDEILCLDESFSQRAFTIMWRCTDEKFSLNTYFDSVPIPDLVVYVDAPVDLCLKRQRERERVTVAKDWETDDPENVQMKSQNLCLNIRDYLQKETSVITVENTDSVKKAAEKVLSKIQYTKHG